MLSKTDKSFLAGIISIIIVLSITYLLLKYELVLSLGIALFAGVAVGLFVNKIQRGVR